ncbi:MAG: carboxypeptidase-like regulatory domain-containing protein [Armatimonadota bacterium]
MATRDHLTPEELLACAEGSADDRLLARVRRHLESGCAGCSAELDSWTRMHSALQADREPGAPDWVLERALGMIDRIERQPTLWERITAALVWDSRTQPVPAGIRDAGSNAFSLLFKADSIHVDLLCEREGNSWRITGQVLSEPPAELPWRASLHGGGESREAEVARGGELSFENVPPGTYSLTLTSQGRSILLPDIRLSPA